MAAPVCGEPADRGGQLSVVHPIRLAMRRPASTDRSRWRADYVRSIVAGDLLCALVAGGAGYLARFGDDQLHGRGPSQAAMVVACLPIVWIAGMFAARSYEQRFLWVGADEFRRVTTAAVWVLAAFGTLSWAVKWDIARGFVIVALPLATVLTLLQRYARRQVLHRQRARGLHRQTTLVVGHRSSVAALHAIVDASTYQGLEMVGCCIPDPRRASAGQFDGLPVLGSLDDVIRVVKEYDIDVVAVLPSPELEGAALRQLGWDLEQTNAHLLLAPAVTEVAGPRVAIRPVAGLPLLHVERPELTGARRIAKVAFDVTTAAIGLICLLPLLLILGALVASTSPGPVFYRQDRVGRDGQVFPMLKFRSMVVGADRKLAELMADSDGNDVLFKMRNDPRVTRVGRVLRRYSLDELPQLINVLLGHMSLVGPRPPLPHETDRYGFDMHRRFLVKPGMTGLWQISGRSDLSWDDSVRMDVRYVENWSFGMDLFILWKTIGAVRGGTGAY
jgi:exopolysaccharide biosynthesis polyprenyl glycosylphosphotransferase